MLNYIIFFGASDKVLQQWSVGHTDVLSDPAGGISCVLIRLSPYVGL